MLNPMVVSRIKTIKAAWNQQSCQLSRPVAKKPKERPTFRRTVSVTFLIQDVVCPPHPVRASVDTNLLDPPPDRPFVDRGSSLSWMHGGEWASWEVMGSRVGAVDSSNCSWVRVRIIDLRWNTNTPSHLRPDCLHQRIQAPTQGNRYHHPGENDPKEGLTTEHGRYLR